MFTFGDRYLQSILQLGYDWALGDESKQLTLDCVRKRDDESHEHGHLEDQEEKHLLCIIVSVNQ